MPKNQRKLRAVIITALPVERQAVLAYLPHFQQKSHPEGTIYHRGTRSGNTYIWEVFVVEIGMGNTDAALETERALQYLQPQVTLFVGVAGGLKDVSIGDVVAATKIYQAEAGKADIVLQPRPQTGQATYRMEQRARAEAGMEYWLKYLKTPRPSPPPAVYLGAIAAMEKVVSSTQSDIYAFLRAQYGDALAIEMEGYGFLRAVRANHSVEALVIRGISDLVEGKSAADASGSQKLAAHHASAFAFAVLAGLGNDPSFSPTTPQDTPPSGTGNGNTYIRNTGQMAVGPGSSMTIYHNHNSSQTN